MIFIKSRPFIIIITEVSEFQNAGIAKTRYNLDGSQKDRVSHRIPISIAL